MRLGDLDRLAKDIELAVEDAPLHVQATVQQYIDCSPTIDPIRAAGGCRCGECKKYHDGTGWCEEHSYFCDSEGIPCSPAESREWKIFQEREYCSKSEPREAQGDG